MYCPHRVQCADRCSQTPFFGGSLLWPCWALPAQKRLAPPPATHRKSPADLQPWHQTTSSRALTAGWHTASRLGRFAVLPGPWWQPRGRAAGTSQTQPGTRWLAAGRGRTQGDCWRETAAALRRHKREASCVAQLQAGGAWEVHRDPVQLAQRGLHQQGAIAVATRQHPVPAGSASASSGSSADGARRQSSPWIRGAGRRHQHSGHAAAFGWHVSGQHLAAMHGQMCLKMGTRVAGLAEGQPVGCQ